MIGVIERIKNSVLLRCSSLNDKVIDVLDKKINTVIYHFAEDLFSMLSGINTGITEDKMRADVKEVIYDPIIKKMKRKLFIDSLALQITNDGFIESYVNKNITKEKLNKTYLSELKNNENSNQLNMTEDLKLDDIIKPLQELINTNIIPIISENKVLTDNVNLLIKKTKDDLENVLTELVNDTDNKYLEILNDELEKIVDKKEEGEEKMEDVKEIEILNDTMKDEKENSANRFDKYDDMTLFNKMILSLNTKEEKLSRKEAKQEKRRAELDDALVLANKNIELNIERESDITKRKEKLDAKELDINSKLAEAEVIFLNMKPLIKGLNSINSSDEKGGNENE